MSGVGLLAGLVVGKLGAFANDSLALGILDAIVKLGLALGLADVDGGIQTAHDVRQLGGLVCAAAGNCVTDTLERCLIEEVLGHKVFRVAGFAAALAAALAAAVLSISS